MRALWKEWGGILAALGLVFLTACAGGEGGVTKALDRVVDASAEAQAENPGGALDALADRVIAAKTNEERALRVCMLSAMGTEQWAYRLRYFPGDPSEVMIAHSATIRMKAAVEQVRANVDSSWFETEMFYTVVEMERAVEGVATDRVTGVIAKFAGGLNVGNVLTSFRKLAGQGALLAAMTRDVNGFYTALDAEDVTVEDGWAMCESRMAVNETRVKALMGLFPAPVASPAGAES